MTEVEISELAGKIAEKIAVPISYTAEELAEKLHVNRNKISIWRRYGAIRGIRVGAKWIYPTKEVLRFLDDYLGIDLRNERATILTTKALGIENENR
jgi:hypothetical protein